MLVLANDIVETLHYLAKVTAEADRRGLLPALTEQLKYLANFGSGDHLCVLGKDFAPLSFRFLMLKRAGSSGETTAKPSAVKGYDIWFGGGLVYHGPDAPGDGSMPALSVSLDDAPTARREVHT